jgi:NADH:ubiquinone oxidoreductase subunit 3 (subunit A)
MEKRLTKKQSVIIMTIGFIVGYVFKDDHSILGDVICMAGYGSFLFALFSLLYYLWKKKGLRWR